MSSYVVLCDFDGTISQCDVAFEIIKNFSIGDWQSLEKQYQTGIISSRVELAKQFMLVKESKEELLDFVDSKMQLDPTFSDFAEFCNARGIKIIILSEGLSFYIEHMLAQIGLSPEVRANTGVFTDDGIIMEYHSQHEDCLDCGNCKLATVREFHERGYEVIYIGDGSSDFCASKHTDLIFAKRKLARHLSSEKIEHNTFNRFSDIIAKLETMT